MLELEKIKYTERPSAFHPESTEIIGSLVMHAKVTIDNKAGVPRDFVNDNIHERIWRMAYEELREPLCELQLLAQRTAPPEHMLRVRELCEKINTLLTRKSPNDPS